MTGSRSRAMAFAIFGALALVVASLSAVPIAAGAAAPAETVRPAGLAPQIPHGSVAIGRVADAQPFVFEIALAPSHTAEMQALLDAQRDPASPLFGHYLAHGEFAQQFGPSASSVAAVNAWLHTNGLTDTSLNGFTLTVHTTSGAAARALGVGIERYRTPDNREVFSADAAPLVPAALLADITSIVGLTNTPAAHPQLDTAPRVAPTAATRAVPHADGLTPCPAAANFASNNGFWTPDQVGSLYDVGTLLLHGQAGAGKTIALVELAPHDSSDTAAFLTCFGLHNPITTTVVDTGGTASSNGTLEANIDIEEAAAQAPKARVISYEGPNSGTGEFDVYQQIVNDDTADAVSTSWGFCEPLVNTSFMSEIHVLLTQALMQGQTVVAASGDSGSEDCLPANSSTGLAVDSPANDPLVTGVGGTSLLSATEEPVWNDCEGAGSGATCNGGGGGGGLSQHFTRPSWQPLRPGGSCAQSSCRQVPDVAANAGIGEVFHSSGGWGAVGGTSIAAPKIAGIVADIDTQCTQRVGDLAPKLVTLARSGGYGFALADVTDGDNDLTRSHAGTFAATIGLDMATGAGTPIASGWSCPQVNAISKTRVAAGTHITIAGLGLANATITFGTATATVLTHHATTLTVVVPPGSGTVTVHGANAIGAGAHSVQFTYAPSSHPNPPPPTPVNTTAYRTVASDGGIFSFGGAPFYGSTGNIRLNRPIVGAASDAVTGGYWFVASDGGIFGFHASFLGSLASAPPATPVVGMAATPNGKGYWLATAGGSVSAFGDAPALGSAIPSAPIVGIASAPDGKGYWLAGSDGGIYAFGSAHDYGSMAGTALTQPIVAITADAATGGYWMVAADGGIFGFHASFFGSTGAIRLNQPIVGIAATSNGKGYWMVARDGGIFAFGNAKFSGSMGGQRLNQPMVGMAVAS